MTLEEASTRQARAGLREARPRAARPRAGDRHRLGRLRRLRRPDARLPRHHHDAVAGAARRSRSSASTRPASRIASRCSLEDYRELRGRFDKLVSIEMIEAVGWKDFGTFFARCSDLLEPNGAMLLQAITIDDRAYEVERASRSFIRTHIFPNGCLPSIEVIARCLARRTDLRMAHLEDIETALRGDAAPLAGERRTPRGPPRRARLRRALPAAVAAVPVLLRGRIRRAPHRRRPDGSGQAPLGCDATSRGVYTIYTCC